MKRCCSCQSTAGPVQVIAVKDGASAGGMRFYWCVDERACKARKDARQ